MSEAHSCCNTLQNAAKRSNTLQHAATHLKGFDARGPLGLHETRTRYDHLLQCVAVCCSVLQCVAVRCSVLQCVAVCRCVVM